MIIFVGVLHYIQMRNIGVDLTSGSIVSQLFKLLMQNNCYILYVNGIYGFGIF